MEPEGTVEIKYKDKDLIKTMARIDTPLREYASKLRKEDTPLEEQTVIKKKILERQDFLKPMYHQVSFLSLTRKAYFRPGYYGII